MNFEILRVSVLIFAAWAIYTFIVFAPVFGWMSREEVHNLAAVHNLFISCMILLFVSELKTKIEKLEEKLLPN